MIQIKFYTFNKRTNSTKVPTGSGSIYNCTLKDDTSILEPVIRLQTSNNVKVYNYAYIADFGRYYFVTDIVSSKGFWEISLKVDTLASEKTGIGAMSAYVIRAASESDEYILDETYPADSYITEYISNPLANSIEYPSTQNPFGFRTSSGNARYSYILGIIGAENGSIGSVTYYQMNQDQLNSFMNYLFGATSLWSDISTSDYSDGVQRALLNPMQYIVSCIMVPIDHSNILFDGNEIKFGTYSYSGTNVANKLFAEAGSIVTEMTSIILLPSHPQASTRGKYLNGAPYSKYWLHLGPYGDIPLNGNFADLITAGATENDRYITVDMILDLSSGLCECIIYPGKLAIYPFTQSTGHLTPSNTKRLGSVTVQAGVPIQLAQAYTDPIAVQEAELNIVGAATGVVGSIASNNIPGAVGGLASIGSCLGNLFRASYPKVSSTGSNGSAMQGYLNDEGIYIRSEHNRIVPENNTDLGRPLCQVKTINTLSGFILCSGADYGGAGTLQERDEINGYLNGGFFYE